MSSKSKTTGRRATKKKTSNPSPRWAKPGHTSTALGSLEVALTIARISSVLIEDVARASLGPDATEKEVCELCTMLIARAAVKTIRGHIASDGVRTALTRGMERALGELPE